MKNWTIVGLVVALVVIGVFAAFLALDGAMERDDMRAQIELQRRELAFFGNIINDTLLKSCALKVDVFEADVQRLRHTTVRWGEDSALVGPYRVTRSDACIEKIELVAF